MSSNQHAKCAECGHVLGIASGAGGQLRIHLHYPIHLHYGTLGLHCPGCGEEILADQDFKFSKARAE